MTQRGPRLGTCSTFLFLLVMSLLLACSSNVAHADDWQLLLEDNFDRQMMGRNWRMLRGDWRIENDRLLVTRQWPSDSAILCRIPMRAPDQRASFDVILREGDTLSAYLRSGEILWGGGGIHESFGIRLQGASKEKVSLKHEQADGHRAPILIVADQPHRVVLTIQDGKATAALQGHVVRQTTVAPARSSVNIHFAITSLPNGAIDNLTLEQRGSTSKTIPEVAPADAMRILTTEQLSNADRPGDVIQSAIDSLPQTGGAVLLPEGRFVIRRHIQLRSGVCLRGQGMQKTTLKLAPIIYCNVEQVEGNVVTVDNAQGLATGDAVSLGRMWAHPGTVGAHADGSNRGARVVKVEGNRVTLSEPAPEKMKQLLRFFPGIYARMAEFIEVSDLAIEGPDLPPDSESLKISGRFMCNPITFGVVYGARIHRVKIRNYPADGVSLQGGADCIITHNDVAGAHQAFHPGTTTARLILANNKAIGNNVGLYFCWYNRNGLYLGNQLDSISGFADSGDVFNIVAGNELTQPLTYTTGYNAIILGNKMPSLTIQGGERKPGQHAYQQPGRYLVVAHNQVEKIELGENTAGHVISGNAKADGSEATLVVNSDANVFTNDEKRKGVWSFFNEFDLEAYPGLSEVEKVHDASTWLDESDATQGLQKAIEVVAEMDGGIIRIPAGIYHLKQPLVLHSKVGLVGFGPATVLVPTRPSMSLFEGKGVESCLLADMTLRSANDVEAQSAAPPAIELVKCFQIAMTRLDVRDWHGDAIRVADATVVSLNRSRILSCNGDGIAADLSSSMNLVNSMLHGSQNGVRFDRMEQSWIIGCIAADNRQHGFALEGNGLFLSGSNANNNAEAGVMVHANAPLGNASSVHILGNIIMNNAVGVRLKDTGDLHDGPRGIIHYNNFSDEQIHPTQQISFDFPTDRFHIVGNVATPLYPAREPATYDEDIRTHNITETITPTGSSIEWVELQKTKRK